MLDFIKEPQWLFGPDQKFLPIWSIGIDSYIQLFNFLVTLIIGLAAYKIYKLSQKKESLLLASGFFSISLANLVWSMLNTAIILKLGIALCDEIHMCQTNLIIDILIYLHMFLKLFGFMLLAFVSIKEIRAFVLIFLSYMLVIIISNNTLFFFFLFSSLLLFYLLLHYGSNYAASKRIMHLLMAISFGFIAFGHLFFLFGLQLSLNYLIGNFFVFMGYVLIMFDLIFTLKK